MIKLISKDRIWSSNQLKETVDHLHIPHQSSGGSSEHKTGKPGHVSVISDGRLGEQRKLLKLVSLCLI